MGTPTITNPRTRSDLSSAMCVYTTPQHFDVTVDFVEHPSLTIDEEFDLVAPVYIYLAADLKYERKARNAAMRLKRIGHPLMDGLTVADLMTGRAPTDFGTRYQQLMMALAEDEIPGIESYIDADGAFSFKHAGDTHVLMGDACGSFAFYLRADDVRRRLNEAART
jgi:hypothetical protein